MPLLLIRVLSPLVQSVIFFGCLVLFQWLGRRYRLRRKKKWPDDEHFGLGLAENSLIGLTTLLLAFSFNITASKFEKRRDMIVDEAASIRTAILKARLYPDSIRPQLLTEFKNYVDARIAYFDAGEKEEKVMSEFNRAKDVANGIWNESVERYKNAENPPLRLEMVSALTTMTEQFIRRDASRKFVVPKIILRILVLMLLLSSFLAGYGAEGKKRNLVLAFIFSWMTALALYQVLELDRPRSGFINLSDAEQQIVDLRMILPE